MEGVKIELWCLLVIKVTDDVLNFLVLLLLQIKELRFVVKLLGFSFLEYLCEYRVYIVVCVGPITESIAIKVLTKMKMVWSKRVPI